MAIDIQKTKELIRTYILKEFFPQEQSEILDDTPLISSGIMDSISVLHFVDFLEGEFGIEFEAHEVDADNLNSINIVVSFINAKL